MTRPNIAQSVCIKDTETVSVMPFVPLTGNLNNVYHLIHSLHDLLQVKYYYILFLKISFLILFVFQFYYLSIFRFRFIIFLCYQYFCLLNLFYIDKASEIFVLFVFLKKLCDFLLDSFKTHCKLKIANFIHVIYIYIYIYIYMYTKITNL